MLERIFQSEVKVSYMDSAHLQSWFETPRELSMPETKWFDVLLSVDLVDKEVLSEQVKHAKVIGECTCGCKTINIRVDTSINQYPYSERIPVEMVAYEPGKAPIMFLLHVVNGYISELEVLRADSSPIIDEIDLSNVEVQINIT